MTESKIIEFKNVSLAFGTTLIHKDISFSISRSEVVTLLGPSGVGKTLILKMLAGLIRPTSGEIYLLGTRIDNLHEDELFEVRKEIGMLFQGAALFDSLTVAENICYPLVEAGETDLKKLAEVVRERLEVVGLSGTEHKLPAQLSGGQKKRVGLARALAVSPQVMLFDEPTTGLDPTSVRLIDDLILKLKKTYGITSLVITHDIESAKRISDRWMLVNDGRIIADGAVSEVSSSNQAVQDFISGNWG